MEQEQSKKHSIRICNGFSCSQKLGKDLLRHAKEATRNREDIEVEPCNCQGQCSRGSNIIIDGEIKNDAYFDDIDETVKGWE